VYSIDFQTLAVSHSFLEHTTIAKNLSKQAACHQQKQKNAGAKILLSSFKIKISPQKLI